MGPPADLPAALATLRSLPELGVNFVDTSNAYGPVVSELLVREALHPYRDIVIATKGGLLRPGPNQWSPDGRPKALRLAVENSLKVLGIERIDLWQLHRVDPNVPQDEQFATIAELQREGLIRHVGLSEVSVEQIDAARKHFVVASVQNGYHVVQRKSEAVLERCEQDGIPFIAYFPLGTGSLAAPDSVLTRVAQKLGITAAQAALAWLLKRSKSLVVIPGTSRPDHARENVAAGDVQLSDDAFEEIARIGQKAALLRAPRS
jgi:aryl-alcohol dehydrogenase-like predicted oxidoreductase